MPAPSACPPRQHSLNWEPSPPSPPSSLQTRVAAATPTPGAGQALGEVDRSKQTPLCCLQAPGELPEAVPLGCACDCCGGLSAAVHLRVPLHGPPALRLRAADPQRGGWGSAHAQRDAHAAELPWSGRASPGCSGLLEEGNTCEGNGCVLLGWVSTAKRSCGKPSEQPALLNSPRPTPASAACPGIDPLSSN